MLWLVSNIVPFLKRIKCLIRVFEVISCALYSAIHFGPGYQSLVLKLLNLKQPLNLCEKYLLNPQDTEIWWEKHTLGYYVDLKKGMDKMLHELREGTIPLHHGLRRNVKSPFKSKILFLLPLFYSTLLLSLTHTHHILPPLFPELFMVQGAEICCTHSDSGTKRLNYSNKSKS